MNFSASNIENDAYDIEIELNDFEKEEADISASQFSFAISRCVWEFLHLFAKNKQQASTLYDLIQTISRDTVEEYIEESFDEVVALREEAQMYGYMEDIYEHWLESNSKSESEVVSKFQNADTMQFEVYEKFSIITIALTNSDGTIFEFLETFNASDLNEREIEQKASMAYIVSTVISDKIYNNEKANPIRQLEHTPGFADGGIMKLIQNISMKKGE